MTEKVEMDLVDEKRWEERRGGVSKDPLSTVWLSRLLDVPRLSCKVCSSEEEKSSGCG